MSKFSQIRTPAPNRAARAIPRKTATAAAAGRGGRSGDRRNYAPLTVYIDRPIYQAFKARLAIEDRGFSEVLTGLMKDWLSR